MRRASDATAAAGSPLWCRIQFHRTTYQGRYTPPTTKTSYLEYPSYKGGTDWGSAAVDPARGILIVNYNNMANNDRLLTRKEADDLGLKPINVAHKPQKSGRVEYGPQAGAPYAIEVNPGWRMGTGLMCTRPPYGGITAIELATGKTIWDEPLGEARANGPFGIPSLLPLTIGTPNNGGALITAGGLVFIAAATDNLIRAIDIDTGKVLWKDTLPAGGQATPMAFEENGREYIGFMAGDTTSCIRRWAITSWRTHCRDKTRAASLDRRRRSSPGCCLAWPPLCSGSFTRRWASWMPAKDHVPVCPSALRQLDPTMLRQMLDEAASRTGSSSFPPAIREASSIR